MNESEYKIIISGLNEQYGAAIEMLEKTIDLCPPVLWNEEKNHHIGKLFITPCGF